MVKYGFAFHADRCTGCKTCMLSCMDYYDLTDIEFRKVYEYGGGTCTLASDGTFENDTFTYYVSVACNHCDDPACMKVCPTTAMHKDERGLVCVDSSKCVGCGYCEFACPYGAPKVDRAAGYSRKCTGCSERVAQGLSPICVEACPLRALEFGSVEEMAQAGNRADIAPLPEPGYTNPNLYVKKCVNACFVNDELGVIQNVLEVE